MASPMDFSEILKLQTLGKVWYAAVLDLSDAVFILWKITAVNIEVHSSQYKGNKSMKLMCKVYLEKGTREENQDFYAVCTRDTDVAARNMDRGWVSPLLRRA
ncbi:MAG: hypothetical protein U9R20_03690 [Thermodesulfobacteriota bacterium]|nr:hypothetical protein [Thermodesulfobacteriota bacterium]